jgi:multisubunit Na+/H+ antiporter MnhF subunit
MNPSRVLLMRFVLVMLTEWLAFASVPWVYRHVKRQQTRDRITMTSGIGFALALVLLFLTLWRGSWDWWI